jgi:hypothetical protein
MGDSVGVAFWTGQYHTDFKISISVYSSGFDWNQVALELKGWVGLGLLAKL